MFVQGWKAFEQRLQVFQRSDLAWVVQSHHIGSRKEGFKCGTDCVGGLNGCSDMMLQQ
jgi:hypothetical protein